MGMEFKLFLYTLVSKAITEEGLSISTEQRKERK